ncbi:MAG TPA: hypothetical protein PKV72_02310 [Candidatus Peribacteria bacterium]|nr:hypothetical protein [Candidatus Peribacteria bacterium]
MIRLHTPEQAPDDAPRDGDLRALRRRVSDLEIDRNALREQLRRQRGGSVSVSEEQAGAPTRRQRRGRTAESRQTASQPLTAGPEARVEGPKSLAELEALLKQIGDKEHTEIYTPADSVVLDELYARLGATALGPTDYNVTRPIADVLEGMKRTEQNDASPKPERVKAITAALAQLQPHLPRRGPEIASALDEILTIKEREEALFKEQPLPKFDTAGDRRLMDAYAALANTPFSCTPAEASALLAKFKELSRKEDALWNYKFPRGENQQAAQAMHDGRRVMIHERGNRLMKINAKLSTIANSSNMFWRMLGRAPEHLAA